MAALLDIVKKGSTDRSVSIRIIDSTDGTPENGVVFNTSGIDLWYRREGAAKTSITEATLSALTDAHSDGGFLFIGDGEYRLDLPDAAFATGANYVDVGGTVTGMVVIGGRVRLVDYDPEDTVRLGLTVLPNAAAEAAGGLYTRGTGAGQINQAANGTVDANTVRVGNTVQTAGDIPARLPAALTADGNIKADTLRIGGTLQTAGDIGAITAAQSEPGSGAPAANATPLTKIAYLYKAWRNRSTQTATAYNLYSDDATTVDQKATVTDNGTTFDRNEIVAGP